MLQKEKTKYYIFMLFISLLIFKLVNNTGFFIEKFNFFISLIAPFIWAFSIAYLLNPILIYVEKNFKINRSFSILLIYCLLLSIITITITIVSPRIAKSIDNLSDDIPTYIYSTQSWVNENIVKSKLLEYSAPYIKTNINRILEETLSFLNLTSANLVTKAINITSNLFSAILGLVVSIYLLKDKERFIIGIKKILYALVGQNKANNIINFGNLSNKIFSQYIIGKAIDSLIIGMLCFVGLLLLKMRYALLIGIIIGITNMIPYFGPFIGAVPAILITLIYSPINALWVGIFIFLLQQFDGLYLGPKILGDKVGLGPIWIILAVIIGGGTFGVIGMFIGVPVMAIIKIELEKYINHKINSRDIL